MTDRIIETDGQLSGLVRFLENLKPPFTVSITKGKHRTSRQNKLQRLWCNEIAEQLEQTPEEVRGYSKLTIGVPILRAENAAFCEAYDRIIKPMSYETKLELMMEPMDWPVTRIMTTKQKATYLDAMYKHFAEKGLVLTAPDLPEEMGR